MKIGKFEFESPCFVLAPMCAINCCAQRIMCKNHGASLIYTQMIDSDIHFNKTSSQMKKFLNINDLERPVSVQISGSERKKILKTLKLVQEFADIVDFNCGCVLEKILKKKQGAYLLKDPDYLVSLVKFIVDNSKIPVTVKIRIGWDSQNIIAVKLAKRLKQVGVSAIAIHGRCAEQKYSGKSNWMIQKQIKESLGKDFPVIFNGDVTSYEKGIEMLEKTNCDAVMIGRSAIHSPWVFNKNFKKTNLEVINQIFEFARLYKLYDNRFHLNELREHIFWKFKDVVLEEKFNPKIIHNLNSYQEILDFLNDIKKKLKSKN